MSDAQKVRKSVPIFETVAVDTREVNVAIEGLDYSGIASSFTVHLVKDGQRIASRFFFQPLAGTEAVGSGAAVPLAHFDFLLPIDVVAHGKLRVEIEPLEPAGRSEPFLTERIGQPTLSVYLMLESVTDERRR